MCLYLPINGTHEVLSVVGIVLKDKIDSFEKNLWLAILDECGMALKGRENRAIFFKAEKKKEVQEPGLCGIFTAMHQLAYGE